MGSLKLLGDWILTFDKVRRTNRKVFHSKYSQKMHIFCFWMFFWQEEKKTDKLVMSCRLFPLSPQPCDIRKHGWTYWRGGSLLRKYYTFYLRLNWRKKEMFSCVLLNLSNCKGVSWRTKSCMILVSTLRKYFLLRLSPWKLKMRFPTFFFNHFCKAKKILQDISLLLNSTFFKIGAHEPRWAAYLERFWFLLIKVGQGRRSRRRSRSFFSHLRNRCRQRMQYLGAPHNISFCGKVSDEKVKKTSNKKKIKRMQYLGARHNISFPGKSFWWKSQLCTQSSWSKWNVWQNFHYIYHLISCWITFFYWWGVIGNANFEYSKYT